MNIERRTCQNCRQQFLIEPDDFGFYEKIKVPPPTFCYKCRAQRRMAFRNERALNKRKSSLSGKDIFSTYPADVKFPVYTQEEWFSDVWDPMKYGREYDFNKPFFEQFRELSNSVPKPAKSATGGVNSEYSNNFTDLKNCYLVFNAEYIEDSAYCTTANKSNNCLDNTFLERSELCYENFITKASSRVFFSHTIADSNDIWFSKNLRGCNNCFGCVNLRGKNYHIFNQPYSKNEYAATLKTFNLGSCAEIQKLIFQSKEFWFRFPNKYIENGTPSFNVSGDYVFSSKEAKNCYITIGGENLKYCQYLNFAPTKDCYDYFIYGANAELVYECAMLGGNAHNTRFCLQSWPDVRDLEYCEYCMVSSDLFGCVSLRNKQYCILNKQYTKEEFHDLRKKIIEHMHTMPHTDTKGIVYRYGEFFPVEFSPFGYNQTVAYEHFPLTQQQAIERGYAWRDPIERDYQPTMKAGDIPDQSKDVPGSIVNEIIQCSHEGKCAHNCTSAFRIITQELQFYRRFALPFPRLCVSCRHYERLQKRNSLHLYHRTCMCSQPHPHHEGKCPNEFETSYAPERTEIVYCESCYQNEVA